jgi:hypothetical protein
VDGIGIDILRDLAGDILLAWQCNGQRREGGVALAVAQEAALSTATRRVEQLTAEAAKRDQLLGAAQAALEQSGGRLSAATADRDDKLRAALEVSQGASLMASDGL